MNVLIIGSNGFIGQSLVRYFTAHGFVVTGCDLGDKPLLDCRYLQKKPSIDWSEIFSSDTFDYCINAAGSGNVNLSVQQPLFDFEANTVETARILDAIRLQQPECRYLHISSAAVYGNPTSLPVKETTDCRPMSPYGWHKLMSEALCREYVSMYGLRIAVVRPFSIYGPGLRKQLFWDTYQKYLQSPGHVSLWGTGRESRDFIYIDDVPQAFHLILQKGALQAEVYNLASGVETTIRDVVHLLFEKAKREVEIVFNQQVREGDPLNWRADISRLQSLGFQPATDLHSGIGLLAEWLNQQGK